MADLRNQARPGASRRVGHSPKGRRGARLARILFRLCVLLALGGGAWKAWEQFSARQPGPLFPFEYVRIEGEIENLDLAKLQEALRPALHGGYFSQDMGEVEGAIRSFAWVDGVRFARVWPDTLEITLSEQKAVARWGDRALLNPRGEKFTPDGIEAFASLPVIYGPPGMETYLLDMLKSLNKRLESKGVSVASLDMSKRRSWTVKLSNGLELLFGRQDPIKLLERFLELVPQLGEESFARLQRVDLRYPSGFAVVWAPAVESVDDIKQGNGVAPQNQ